MAAPAYPCGRGGPGPCNTGRYARTHATFDYSKMYLSTNPSCCMSLHDPHAGFPRQSSDGQKLLWGMCAVVLGAAFAVLLNFMTMSKEGT